MPIPDRQTLPTSSANLMIQVTDDGSRTLLHRDTGDAFHSGCGAVTETRHVYLRNSGVADRLAQGLASSVLEIGLGTAMGLLLTADAAAAANTKLQYTAWESHWLPADVLRPLQLGQWLNHPNLAADFLCFRDTLPSTPPAGVYHWAWSGKDHAGVSAQIHVGDVRRETFESDVCYDAIYFDPFAPSSNPELWQSAFLRNMHHVLAPEGRLVTYCCSRQVRDALTSVGFDVARVPGPLGGKREVLIATKGMGASATG